MNDFPTVRQLFEDAKFQKLVSEVHNFNPAIGTSELAESVDVLNKLTEQVALSAIIEQCGSPTLVNVIAKPKRPHRKKRIRKKWMKRYGVKYTYGLSYEIPIKQLDPMKPIGDTVYVFKPHVYPGSLVLSPEPLYANINVIEE